MEKEGEPPNSTRMQATRLTARALTALALVATAIVFLVSHHLDPLHPTGTAVRNGFWWWTDQHRYLEAALAWARGDLDPAEHWYFPGYPLLAAPFVFLRTGDPFLIPDLLCSLATLACCAELTRRLAPDHPWARTFGALAFAVIFMASGWFRESWIIPWSTTPVVPLTLTAILLVLRLQDAPAPSSAFLLGLTAASVALFRPTDALVLIIVCPIFVLVASMRQRARELVRIILAAALGGVAPLTALLAIHLAVHGWTKGSYLIESANTGFEWRLVPFRWVTIVISPRGVFPDGAGLAQHFPWFAPGIAALVAGVAGLLGGRWRRHLVVGAFVATDMMFYLAYRDLHPQGLWRFNNYHYFKSVLSILAVYSVLLVLRLADSRGRTMLLSTTVAATVALFAWRAEWRPSMGLVDPIVTGPHALSLTGDLHGPLDAILVPAKGSFDAIYGGDNRLEVGKTELSENDGFKAVPVAGGMLLEPLRSIGEGPATFTTDPAIDFDRSRKPIVGHLGLEFGLPCWLSLQALMSVHQVDAACGRPDEDRS